MKNIIKKVILPFSAGLIIAFTACTDSEDLENKGSQAAIEFCDCYEDNSKEECLENLKDRYSSSVYMSDEFIKSFNSTSTCGIELIKEHVKSASAGIENDDGSILNIK